MNLSRIEIDFEDLSDPWQEAWQFLATEFVAIATNDDVSVFTDVKVRVAESPDIEALRLALRGRRSRLRYDERTIGCGSAASRLLKCFCRIQTAILRENGAFSKAWA